MENIQQKSEDSSRHLPLMAFMLLEASFRSTFNNKRQTNTKHTQQVNIKS